MSAHYSAATRWTPAEDAAVLRYYGRRSRKGHVVWRAVLAALPGRTRRAIALRAAVLRSRGEGATLRHHTRWTAAELATLQREWSECARRTLLQKLPGRTWAGIARRAADLGLPSIPQGYVTLATAARRTGYSHEALAALLAAQGVEVRQHTTTRTFRTEAQRWRLVEWDACVEAVEVRVQQETTREAADRLGVSWQKLRRWLTEDGILPPPQHPARPRAHLDPAVYDRVVQAHARPSPVRCVPAAQTARAA